MLPTTPLFLHSLHVHYSQMCANARNVCMESKNDVGTCIHIHIFLCYVVSWSKWYASLTAAAVAVGCSVFHSSDYFLFLFSPFLFFLYSLSLLNPFLSSTLYFIHILLYIIIILTYILVHRDDVVHIAFEANLLVLTRNNINNNNMQKANEV